MASNISSMLQFWKSLNLPQLQRDLDINATELANRQDASDVSRRRLVEQSKEFKKSTSEDIRKMVAPLLRSFQGEIDALSKRSKACEADFLNLYKKLVELPDPVIALEQAGVFQRKAQRLNDVETENQKLRETLAEYNKEFAEVKNQEVTIKNLRERVRDFEKDTENRAKRMTLEKNVQLEKQFAEKERNLQETQLLIATKLGEAEQMATTFKAALDSSQAELFDIKSKYDEELAAKQAELDLLLGDVENTTQRAASAEKELEQLKAKLANDSTQSQDRKKSFTAMEEAIEVLSRSSLETELGNKEKEINQLVEDIQHLQGAMGKLRESSASVIAKLEEEVSQKDALCRELQAAIEERKDYNEIKRELHIIKSTEFSTLDNSSDKQDPQRGNASNAKSLEMLLLEKNRSQQSENTALRAANAQLTDAELACTTPPASPGITHKKVNSFRHREENSPRTPPHRRLSGTSHQTTPNPFALTPDYSNLFESSEALNQLQYQKQQQLNALLNLKILASIKAAVDAQNFSNGPHSSGFTSSVRPSPSSMLFNTRYSSLSPHRPSSSSQTQSSETTHNISALSAYLSQLQKSLHGNAEGANVTGPAESEFYQRSEFSDNSDNENYYDSYVKRKSRRRQFWDENHNISHSSDFTNKHARNSLDTDCGYPSLLDRYRRYSSNTDSRSHQEEVDTDELTSQVKDLLQANNIGQRAFGQYVLGLSQGSVSEILSKPKPWSKLTFKGKEPFYKMMDFVSSSRNVDALKSLQRRDREDRVICSGKSLTFRQSESESDQAIANILAAAKEEMKIEQEKLKRAQKLYGLRNLSSNLTASGRAYKSREDSFDENSTELRRSESHRLRSRAASSELLESMTMMAAGRYSHSYSSISKESDTMTHFTSGLDSVDTNGAIEPSVETALPSLIKRQQAAYFTGNESGRAVKIHKDKQDSVEHQCNRVVEAKSLEPAAKKSRTPCEGFSGNISLKLTPIRFEGQKKQTENCSGSNSLVKSEPNESSELSGFFNNSEKVTDHDSYAKLDASSDQYSAKEHLIAENQRLISNHESESLQRLFVTTTYNDPFIPPPLSPAAEEGGSRTQHDRTSPGSKEDQSHCYGSPFLDDDSVSSHFMNENSAHPDTDGNFSTEKSKSNQRLNDRRKRVVSLSPPSTHSGGLLSEPALFKELSCSSFHDSDRDNFPGNEAVSSTTPSTFANMLSSNQHSNMSTLQTSSNTSMYSAQVSYTELNPVTTGSLFNSHRDIAEHEFNSSSSNGYSSVEGNQHGIASMLAPLGLKTSHQTSSPPTYTTLSNTMPASSHYSPDTHIKMESNYDGDLIETSTLSNSPLTSEALHKLSMSHVDTAMLTKEVRDRLAKHGICQRIFGERILGLSQGTVSDILSHPKPWGKLTHKGREPFARMIMWLSDSAAGGLLTAGLEGTQANNGENIANSPTSDCSNNGDPVNLSKDQPLKFTISSKSHSPGSNGTSDSGGHYVSLSPPVATAAHSPHSAVAMDYSSAHDARSIHLVHSGSDSGQMLDNQPSFHDSDRQCGPASMPDQSVSGGPVTPLQQMLNIQELAASCPKLDTFALTRKVKDILTEHNIGQRIFGQAVLGLTQGSVSDLLSRPKLWRSLSLKGREPFVRMQLWLSDPNNIENLKSLKLERWMEKKWGSKRQRSSENMTPHSLSPVKKQRIVLSTEEKEVLRRAYGIEPYPSQETVDMLAIKLGRKSSTIVNWFHNYRSRVKRGFFPGEELLDAMDKKGGVKITVKQLLDTITLSTSASNAQINRNSFSSANSYPKNIHPGNAVSAGAVRRHNSRLSDQVSWMPAQIPSPPSFDRYNSMEHMKTESMDQHFQNLHRSDSDDIYIKQEAKLLPLHSEHSSMYSPNYSYQNIQTSSSVSDIFKAAEMTLSDPVAMAAATSFIQPKTTHQNHPFSSGPMYHQSIEDHHESYAPFSNENSFKSVPSSTSPHNSHSYLPPVHTLTPKKSFGSPPALSSSTNIILPSASSLLNPPALIHTHNKIPRLTTDPRVGNVPATNMVPYGNSRPVQHLVSLSRPRYDGVVANNNNMNNNSGPHIVKNVTLPGGVSLTVSGSHRQPQAENKSTKTTTVWVTGINDGENSESKQETSQKNDPSQEESPAEVMKDEDVKDSTSDSQSDEKENANDDYAWVF